MDHDHTNAIWAYFASKNGGQFHPFSNRDKEPCFKMTTSYNGWLITVRTQRMTWGDMTIWNCHFLPLEEIAFCEPVKNARLPAGVIIDVNLSRLSTVFENPGVADVLPQRWWSQFELLYDAVDAKGTISMEKRGVVTQVEDLRIGLTVVEKVIDVLVESKLAKPYEEASLKKVKISVDPGKFSRIALLDGEQLLHKQAVTLPNKHRSVGFYSALLLILILMIYALCLNYSRSPGILITLAGWAMVYVTIMLFESLLTRENVFCMITNKRLIRISIANGKLKGFASIPMNCIRRINYSKAVVSIEYTASAEFKVKGLDDTAIECLRNSIQEHQLIEHTDSKKA